MKSVRILVVDDDEDIRANLSDILRDVGYEVDTAADGPQAIALVKKQAYDIALLDLRMPGMDGLEVYRQIKKISAGTVAIIVSAYAGGEQGQQAVHEGAWRAIPKPVDFTQLLRLIEHAAKQPTVIVVDDDSAMCHSLWDLLKDREYRVCMAHTLEESKDRLRQRSFDLALIDMKLPDADGVKVLHEVRRSNPEARVLVITGWRTEMQERVDAALAEGADAVCYKPFDMHMLVTTVDRLATRRKSSSPK